MQNDVILSDFRNFREQLFLSFTHRSDATMELIDSLSSNTSADSVVKLSLNPAFTRSYNSINDVITNFKNNYEQKSNRINLIVNSCIQKEDRKYYLIAVDATSCPRPFAYHTLDRSMVHIANSISVNKPIAIEHKYSVLGYLPEKCKDKNKYSPPWFLPLITNRIPTNNTDAGIASMQISELMQNEKLPFKNNLTVSVLDSYYSHREFVEAQYKYDNLVCVSRLRSNRVLYCYPPPKERRTIGKHPGHELWYGPKFDLKDNEDWPKPAEIFNFVEVTRKNKKMNIEIEAWYDMLMPGKRKLPMYKYPFTLLRITAKDDAGKLIFKRPLWLISWGKRRDELSLLEVYRSYKQRYDIEHYFRFGKNKLLMNKLQTPELQHEESWWDITALAYTQLYKARKLSSNVIYPWEKYLPCFKQSAIIKSPTQVQRSFSNLISHIGTPAAPPKPRGSPLGRLKGYKPPKRKQYSVIIKQKNTKKSVAA